MSSLFLGDISKLTQDPVKQTQARIAMGLPPTLDASGMPSMCAPSILMHTGRCGYMYGNGADVVAASKVIPGGTIKPGCLIKFMGLAAKYAPSTGGGNFRVRVTQGANTILISNASTVTNAASESFDYEVYLSTDLKWSYPKGSTTINFYNAASPAVDTVYSLSTSLSGSVGNANPRSQGNGAAYATYSTSPTVETILIDWSKEVTIEVVTKMVTTDRIELLGFTMLMFAAPTTSAFYGNPRVTLGVGDSLTEGVGSTPTGSIPNDWVSLLGRTRTGTPFINLGLGGQKAQAIVDRIVADSVLGKNARLILWMGTNDIGVAVDPAATILAQIKRLIDFRNGSAQNIIFCTLIPSDAWTAPQLAQKDAVNAMLAANWPTQVCDIQTPLLVGGSGGLVNDAYQSDAIHLNNTGYGIVATALDSKMTALSWAA